MKDLEIAKKLLDEDPALTLVFVRGEERLFSSERGVKPLLSYYDAGKTFSGGAAADRVVGRGAALLYALLNVGELYAKVLSGSAEEVLKAYHIPYSFGERVKFIRNRAGDGVCPIEQATQNILDCEQALHCIRETLINIDKKIKKH